LPLDVPFLPTSSLPQKGHNKGKETIEKKRKNLKTMRKNNDLKKIGQEQFNNFRTLPEIAAPHPLPYSHKISALPMQMKARLIA
jgi:hypothetical protein